MGVKEATYVTLKNSVLLGYYKKIRKGLFTNKQRGNVRMNLDLLGWSWRYQYELKYTHTHTHTNTFIHKYVDTEINIDAYIYMGHFLALSCERA